jgi:pimeloyl-ACP methyl ester carboxylesterase
MTPTVPAARHNTRRRRIRTALFLGALALGAVATTPVTADASRPERSSDKPTIVLVHGAWADASSWTRVVRRLQGDGFPVVAPANPLRSLAADSAYLDSILETIDGPIVLVGHSYGASVVTNAATGDPDVRALVFVNGSVPAEGETVAELAGPESALSVPDPTAIFTFVPAQLPPSSASDVYLKKSTFLRSFATGLRRAKAKSLWATQRPVTLGALNEPSGTPAWDTIPSWYLIGTQDRVIPAKAQHDMAVKAGSTIARFKAGHLGLITDPGAVTRVIISAVRATR